MLEENQNSKEKEVTLNLTEKELEEYKTYIKFKNEIEKQNESKKGVQLKKQNVTQDQSQDNKSSEKSTTKSFQKEMGITDRNDPDYTFSEESIKRTGYKEYFMKPIEIEPIEAYRNKGKIVLILLIVFSYIFYSSSSGYDNTGWTILKILVGFYAMRKAFYPIKQLIVTEPISSMKSKIYSYNALIRDTEWVKLSNNDENFIKYNNIAKYTIKNKLRLAEGNPKLRRDKYTEVYHILNSNMYVVYGIYDSIGFKNTRYLGYMLVIENEECVLNLVAGEVLREKSTILDDM